MIESLTDTMLFSIISIKPMIEGGGGRRTHHRSGGEFLGARIAFDVGTGRTLGADNQHATTLAAVLGVGRHRKVRLEW